MSKKLSCIAFLLNILFPNLVQASAFSKVILTVFAIPVGAVAGAVRGGGSQAVEYSGAFTKAAGGGTLGHVIGVPSGLIVGTATGIVTGAAKGAYKGLTVTRKPKPKPKPKILPTGFDFLTKVLQKAPYQFLPAAL